MRHALSKFPIESPMRHVLSRSFECLEKLPLPVATRACQEVKVITPC